MSNKLYGLFLQLLFNSTSNFFLIFKRLLSLDILHCLASCQFIFFFHWQLYLSLHQFALLCSADHLLRTFDALCLHIILHLLNPFRFPASLDPLQSKLWSFFLAGPASRIWLPADHKPLARRCIRWHINGEQRVNWEPPDWSWLHHYQRADIKPHPSAKPVVPLYCMKLSSGHTPDTQLNST